MGVLRLVNTDFWNDEVVIDNYTPEDKYFWLYLLTNPQSKQLGIYKLPKKIISFQTGYTVETVTTLLDRFQNNYKSIIYSEETQEIAILNYLKYSIIKGGKPVMDCISKDISQIKNKKLLSVIYKRVCTFNDSREVMNSIKELLVIYNDIQNDNDNDNDSIVPRIVPRIVESVQIKEPKVKKADKKDALSLIPLVEQSELSPPLKEVLKEWLEYKKEKKENYTEVGFKRTIAEVKNNAERYGERTLVELIGYCMAQNWKGIVFDRLKEKENRCGIMLT